VAGYNESKIRAFFMTKKILLLLSSLYFVCGMQAAWAERVDRQQPMNIEADSLRHDEVKQTSVFSGKVVMTKGTIVIRGARLEVRQDAQGNQIGIVTAEPGKRAFFRQKRDTLPGQPPEFIEGEGEVIEYDSRTDNVRLVRRAEMRKLRNDDLTDQLTGGVIVYNNQTDVFTVEGQQPSGGKSGGDGRVRAVLSPKDASALPPQTTPDGSPSAPEAAPASAGATKAVP
jgi:lipopolysaccharide export system protein LptA